MAMKSTFNLLEAPMHTEAETTKKKQHRREVIGIAIIREWGR